MPPVPPTMPIANFFIPIPYLSLLKNVMMISFFNARYLSIAR